MKPHWPKVRKWQGVGSMIDALLGLLQQNPPQAETKFSRSLLDDIQSESLLGENKLAPRPKEKPIQLAPRPKEKPAQLSSNSALKEPDFIPKLMQVSEKLNIKPEQLLGAISLETMGTFNPAIKSRLSSASGLIQFLESTANELGTTTEDIRRMSGTDQLDFVEKFLSKSRKRFPKSGATDSDVYMSIFRPQSVGKKENTVLYKRGSKRYEANKALDPNKKGYVTKGMASQVIQPHINKASQILNRYRQSITRQSPP